MSVRPHFLGPKIPLNTRSGRKNEDATARSPLPFIASGAQTGAVVRFSKQSPFPNPHTLNKQGPRASFLGEEWLRCAIVYVDSLISFQPTIYRDQNQYHDQPLCDGP